MNRYALTTALLLVLALQASAQQPSAEKMKRMMDSIKSVYIDMAALRNPALRQASISYETFGSGRITSKLRDQPFIQGRLQTSRITTHFNVPIMHIKRNIIAATVTARKQTTDLYDVENYNPDLQIAETKFDKSTISLMLSGTRLDTLFHRPAVLSATFSAVADPESWQHRFVFTGLMALTLKQTKQTSVTAGLLVLLDPSAPLPLIPFVSYYHKFDGERGELFLDPSRLSFRKQLAQRHFLWVSNNIGSNLMMFDVKKELIPRESVYTTLELKSGLTYEYQFTRKTVLTVSGGALSTLTSKMLKQNENSDPFIKSTHRIVPYAQVSISCLPFWKGFTH